jgi:hypothetical protein
MKTKLELQNERQILYIEKMKLDRFFSMYLDKFGDKMDSDKPNTKIWSLYKSKYNEYEKLNQKIKHLDYWIAKNV